MNPRAVLEERFRAHGEAAKLVVKRGALVAAVFAAVPAVSIGAFMAQASLASGATMFVVVFAEVLLFAAVLPLILWLLWVWRPAQKIRETLDHEDAITRIERRTFVSINPLRVLLRGWLYRSLEHVVITTDAGIELLLLQPPDVASGFVAASAARPRR